MLPIHWSYEILLPTYVPMLQILIETIPDVRYILNMYFRKEY